MKAGELHSPLPCPPRKMKMELTLTRRAFPPTSSVGREPKTIGYIGNNLYVKKNISMNLWDTRVDLHRDQDKLRSFN